MSTPPPIKVGLGGKNEQSVKKDILNLLEL